MTEALPSAPQPLRVQRRLHVQLVLPVLGAALLVACFLGWTRFATRHDRAALALLQARDPAARKSGAWRAARESTPQAHRLIARRLADASQVAADVRESYVYALGRSGEAACFDVVARIIRTDPEPYVRQTAWIAAARLDRDRFRDLAGRVMPGDDAWDHIGLASAWLEVGDLRGVNELLRWAIAGDPSQRHAASLALYRSVGPLLEAVGRWPVESAIREGETWPLEFVEEVERRCRRLKLSAVADDTRRHVGRCASIRRNVGRLHNARGHVARLLFAD